MDGYDKASFAKLWSVWTTSRAAIAEERERLIELAGDRICGSGLGPSPSEIDGLATLEQARRIAWASCLSALLATRLVHHWRTHDNDGD